MDSLQVNFSDLGTALGLGHALDTSDIDFVNLYSSYDNRVDSGTAITAPFKSNSNNNTTNIGFAIIIKGSYYYKPTIFLCNSGYGYIKFFDLTDGSVSTLSNYTSSSSYSFSIDDGGYSQRQQGCGQAVLDCITDSYTGHGWAGVWNFFQTLFIPETAAAILGACIYHNCVQNSR